TVPALQRRHTVLQSRRDRQRKPVRSPGESRDCFQCPGLPLRPLPAPRIKLTVPRLVHPGARGGRRLHPAAPRGEGPTRRCTPGDDVSAHLLRPGGAATSTPARATANPAGGHTVPVARRESTSIRSRPGEPVCRANHSHPARGQEAMPELWDDGERGQHVLLLLRSPVPLRSTGRSPAEAYLYSEVSHGVTKSRHRGLTSGVGRTRTRTSAFCSPLATSGPGALSRGPAPSRGHGPASSRNRSRCNWAPRPSPPQRTRPSLSARARGSPFRTGTPSSR